MTDLPTTNGEEGPYASSVTYTIDVGAAGYGGPPCRLVRSEIAKCSLGGRPIFVTQEIRGSLDACILQVELWEGRVSDAATDPSGV